MKFRCIFYFVEFYNKPIKIILYVNIYTFTYIVTVKNKMQTLNPKIESTLDYFPLNFVSTVSEGTGTNIYVQERVYNIFVFTK